MVSQLLIGERLRSARLSNKMTLAEVGEALGVGHGSVAKWERDENCPTLPHLIKLASLFGAPLQVLIAENLTGIAWLLPEIEKLPESKQQELLSLIQDFLARSSRTTTFETRK